LCPQICYIDSFCDQIEIFLGAAQFEFAFEQKKIVFKNIENFAKYLWADPTSGLREFLV